MNFAVAMMSDSDLNRVDATHAGADNYLLKPIAPHMLGGLVKQLAI
ncbi:MAG: hypothetical protein RR848_10060 [Oscillospiraceae bacterium]